MHYYSRNVGDYAKGTRHLTLIEHGAYTMLLDLAYESEKPLPEDMSVVARLCCARSKEERKAVEDVLVEFFQKAENGGWTHKRVQEELANYHDQSEASRYSNFCKAWKKKHGKKATPVDYETFKKHLPLYLEEASVSEGEPISYRSVTDWFAIHVLTNNQEPITNNQEPVFPPDYPAAHAAVLAEWWHYKRQRRPGYTEIGWQTLLKQQQAFTADQVSRSVEASIASNYAGLFTEKIARTDLRNPVPEKKGMGGGGLDAPPCAEWKQIATANAEEGVEWNLDGVNWHELGTEDRRAVWDAWNQTQKGGSDA